MKILTKAQMIAVEQTAVNNGLSFLRLMENAGSACARIIRDRITSQYADKKRIAIVCGSGKNGGDGFVIARKLYESDYLVDIILSGTLPMDNESFEMTKMVKALNIRVVEYSANKSSAETIIREAGIIVDSIFGTGFKGVPNDTTVELFRTINLSGAVKISVDIPSGLLCDTGDINGEFIRSDLTIAVSALKFVHVLLPAAKYCGEVVVADIGISEEFYSGSASNCSFALNNSEIRDLFPPVDLLSNKGDFGHVLSICGSYNMPGAAVLAAKGAVLSGAGLVTAAFPECAYSAISSKLTEPLLLPLPSNRDGTLSSVALPQILYASRKASCILIGCGVGINPDIKYILSEIIKSVNCPIVIDADGLNALVDDLDLLIENSNDIILTPHPGEMARLTGKSVSNIQNNRTQTAIDFSNEYGVTVVLKGANTVVAENHKQNVFYNTTGNPGMATGGSGDLLAGILASLIAQGIPSGDASRIAVYIHGLAADEALKGLSYRGLTPSAYMEKLPEIISQFESAI